MTETSAKTPTGSINETNEYLNGLTDVFALGFDSLMVVIPVIFLVAIFLVVHTMNVVNETIVPVEAKKRTSIAKLIKKLEWDNGTPDWASALEKMDNEPFFEKELETAFEKAATSFSEKMERFLENEKDFKTVMAGGTVNPTISTLAAKLLQEKKMLMEMAESIYQLRATDEQKRREKLAQVLAERMEVTSSYTATIEEKIKEIRSVEEQVLRDIIESDDTTVDMKSRAGQLLPHFAGKTESEQRQELKQQDFELDLLTLERIAEANSVAVKVE